MYEAAVEPLRPGAKVILPPLVRPFAGFCYVAEFENLYIGPGGVV
jgi:hypothetical protein